MDDDRRELANRLFAAATAMLEDTVEIAAAGQAQRQNLSQLGELGQSVKTAAHDVAIIAEAAVIAEALSRFS